MSIFKLSLDGYMKDKYGDLIKDMTKPEPADRIKLEQVIQKLIIEGSNSSDDQDVSYDFRQ